MAPQASSGEFFSSLHFRQPYPIRLPQMEPATRPPSQICYPLKTQAHLPSCTRWTISGKETLLVQLQAREEMLHFRPTSGKETLLIQLQAREEVLHFRLISGKKTMSILPTQTFTEKHRYAIVVTTLFRRLTFQSPQLQLR